WRGGGLYPWSGRSAGVESVLSGLLRALLEADAAATLVTTRSIVDQFNARGFERLDNLGQGVDGAADNTIAGLHPLNRRQRHPRPGSEALLIDADKGAGGAQLPGGHHVASGSVCINSDVLYINIACKGRPLQACAYAVSRAPAIFLARSASSAPSAWPSPCRPSGTFS